MLEKQRNKNKFDHHRSSKNVIYHNSKTTNIASILAQLTSNQSQSVFSTKRSSSKKKERKKDERFARIGGKINPFDV